MSGDGKTDGRKDRSLRAYRRLRPGTDGQIVPALSHFSSPKQPDHDINDKSDDRGRDIVHFWVHEQKNVDGPGKMLGQVAIDSALHPS